MPRSESEDENLRARALDALGPLGDALAREALERGVVSVEHDVKVWQGTQGTMHGHRVLVTVDAELRARLTAAHAAIDGLSAALASAMAERSGQAVADVRIVVGERSDRLDRPYRGRS